MYACSLTRPDLALLAAAIGPNRRLLVSAVFAAIVHERGLDLQIERDGRDYALVITEIGGDAVVAEQKLPIVWDRLAETVRLHVLGMYVEGILDGHARWRRRMAARLAVLGVAKIPSPMAAAND